MKETDVRPQVIQHFLFNMWRKCSLAELEQIKKQLVRVKK